MANETWRFVVVGPRREQKKAVRIVEEIFHLLHQKFEEVLDGADFEARIGGHIVVSKPTDDPAARRGGAPAPDRGRAAQRQIELLAEQVRER